MPSPADPAPHAPPPARKRLSGSLAALPPGSTPLGAVPDTETVQASIVLKKRDEAALDAELARLHHPDEKRAHLARHRAALYRDDLRALEEFASEHGLSVVAADPARLLLRVSGSAAAVGAAFDTGLVEVEHGGRRFRTHEREIGLPDAVHGRVAAVLGLDTRAIARTHIVRPHRAQSAGLEPNRLGPLYDFPTGVTGAGVTVALIELGGGYRASDNSAAFKAMGLKVPRVIAVGVDGATNAPGSDADGEVALDIQVVGGLAPGAEIAVYFAPNTDAGFADAISQAVHDQTNKPSVISISWGGPESSWTAQAVAAMNTALQDAGSLGLSVFVAAGDSFATDGVEDGQAHVDFPASSPFAIGCGGTRITVSGNTVSNEVVWNDGSTGGGTGGGISALFPPPAFQSGVTLPPRAGGGGGATGGSAGRGVPDVAGDASPASGYVVVTGGQKEVVGGTSAVAPLWAGLAALINSKARTPVGFLPDFLYAQVLAGKKLTVEITEGNNRPPGSAIGYDAGPTWNACTGLGRPDGKALFDALVNRTAATAPAR
ncbi:MAG: S8/S53 family peptidase [Gluconacetobacter diazotrophicus]|nr:S8/S53 family peptidase [Gluconacetobacter diazotrophicus]